MNGPKVPMKLEGEIGLGSANMRPEDQANAELGEALEQI